MHLIQPEHLMYIHNPISLYISERICALKKSLFSIYIYEFVQYGSGGVVPTIARWHFMRRGTQGGTSVTARGEHSTRRKIARALKFILPYFMFPPTTWCPLDYSRIGEALKFTPTLKFMFLLPHGAGLNSRGTCNSLLLIQKKIVLTNLSGTYDNTQQKSNLKSMLI